MARIDPNSTETPPAPLPVLRDVVYSDRNSTPSPSTHANTLPMTTSSARPRSPRRAMPLPTAMVAANKPSRASIPNASAANAPVTDTWLRASPVNTWPRRTTK